MHTRQHARWSKTDSAQFLAVDNSVGSSVENLLIIRDTYRVFTHGVIGVLPITVPAFYTQADGVSNTVFRGIKHLVSWFYPSKHL